MKIKTRVFGVFCSFPFALFFGYALYFLLSHISQFEGRALPNYVGYAIFISITLLGFFKPNGFIGVFRLLNKSSNYDDGGIVNAFFRYWD